MYGATGTAGPGGGVDVGAAVGEGGRAGGGVGEAGGDAVGCGAIVPVGGSVGPQLGGTPDGDQASGISDVAEAPGGERVLVGVGTGQTPVSGATR